MLQLVADGLGKRFGRRVLFRNLSFMLRGGQTLAVTGANGAGKSTLLRILAGVMRPTKGTVALTRRGRALPGEEHPLRTGLVAPYLNVYDGFSACENLQFLARARQLPEAPERIEAVLEMVALASRADDLVGTYSSGMKQRVKYAAALLAEPWLLLLDEPSANLDAAGLDMVERVMAHQREAGRILVIATNIAAEAEQGDTVIRIEDFC
ncbi:MAG TPA: ATP-binding cassette domain-containing protein [Rhodothermales bacterium]|nr:ATP-binding cassette domain-containing protein [Rhodothermales bacterium]